jgi:hypothetical protein
VVLEVFTLNFQFLKVDLGGGVDLLKSVGFTEDGEFLVLKRMDLEVAQDTLLMMNEEMESLKSKNERTICVDYSIY